MLSGTADSVKTASHTALRTAKHFAAFCLVKVYLAAKKFACPRATNTYLYGTAAIKELKDILVQKNEVSELFRNQKDDSFRGTLDNVIQRFSNQYVYPSIEDQGAHLFIVFCYKKPSVF